jgi:hypothetical protein
MIQTLGFVLGAFPARGAGNRAIQGSAAASAAAHRGRSAPFLSLARTKTAERFWFCGVSLRETPGRP